VSTIVNSALSKTKTGICSTAEREIDNGNQRAKAQKKQGYLKSFRELFAGLGSHLLCPTVGESLLLGERILATNY
jgi:hypothetical protein